MGGKSVPLFFTSAQQMNAQLPSTVSSGNLSAQLNREGFSAGTFFLTVADTAPGIFSTTQHGSGPGAILNATTFAAISTVNPAKAGSFVAVFCSGLGKVSNAPADGAAASSSPLSTTLQQPTVTIGGQNATVSFSGLASGFVGLYQVNVQVPSGLAPGAYPLILTIGAAPSNSVTISVN
jgi:uncharacterized protein (TIGR03437 family)